MKKMLQKSTLPFGKLLKEQLVLPAQKKLIGLFTITIAFIGFSTQVQAQATPDASFTITTNAVATYFKSYPNSSVSTDQGISSAGSDFYVSLGSTPSNAAADYIDVTATAGNTIDSITYLVTDNSSTARLVTPAVIAWATSAYSNTAADFSFTGPSATVSKGLANAVWLSYDMHGDGVNEVRFYRAVKGVAVTSPAIATGTTQGGAQTVQFYGIKVYITPTTTPVTFTGITAQQQSNGTVTVAWKVASETAIKQYEVQSSADGINFADAGTVTAKAVGGTASYSLSGVSAVAGTNYYRVKSIGDANGVGYSSMVPVIVGASSISGITVYPNPVTGNHINIRFNNLAAGVYTARLLNMSGQEISVAQLNYTVGGLPGIDIPATVISGTYKLEVSNTNTNATYTTSVVIK